MWHPDWRPAAPAARSARPFAKPASQALVEITPDLIQIRRPAGITGFA